MLFTCQAYPIYPGAFLTGATRYPVIGHDHDSPQHW